MLYLPPLRRLLLPSLICLIFVLAYRSSHRINSSYISSVLLERPKIHYANEHIPISELGASLLVTQDRNGHQITPPQELYYDYVHDEPADQSFQTESEKTSGPHYVEPEQNKFLEPLFRCPIEPNKYTQHIRIPSYIRPISMIVGGDTENEKRQFLNAAPVSLPYWSENQYLLVTRLQTDGTAQLNIICEANICYTDESKRRPGEKKCTEEDLKLLNGTEGMRCATPPLTLNVPPTPAKKCGKDTGALIDIPGFHDPRVFWSGRGEPLMMMNTQSQYACFGLWVIDLRKVHPPLNNLLGANPRMPTLGPLMSYPSMTEITRNPPETRGSIEKNWMFFSSPHSTYVHYDMGPTVRTFAQILGGGLTTENLTDPYEIPCLKDGAKPKAYEVWGGSWHQGTNSLRLVLCERSDLACRARPENTVFWSLIHHKHKNMFALPLRYERYFIVWSSTPPFNMLAMSSRPMLLANETASGWDLNETWDDDPEYHQMIKDGGEGKKEFAVFTYTPSIAYAWGRHEDMPQDKNTGYLDDEVIMGIGIDDIAQAYARAQVSDLLQCMRACPGRSPVRLDHAKDSKAKSSFFEDDDKIRDTITKGLNAGKTIPEIVFEEEEGGRPEANKFDDPADIEREAERKKQGEEDRRKKEEEEKNKQKEEEEKKKKNNEAEQEKKKDEEATTPPSEEERKAMEAKQKMEEEERSRLNEELQKKLQEQGVDTVDGNGHT